MTNKAFTLVELIISIIISAIILLFLTNFIADSFNEISYSNKEAKILTKLYEIKDKLKIIKQQYLTWSILKNWSWGITSDIILFKTLPWEPKQWWYIIAIVNKDTLKIDSENNVWIIWPKVLWYRKISSSELSSLDSTNVYDLKFNQDEIFPDIFLKDLQASFYNSGSILDMNLYINLDYKESLNWTKYFQNNKIVHYLWRTKSLNWTKYFPNNKIQRINLTF